MLTPTMASDIGLSNLESDLAAFGRLCDMEHENGKAIAEKKTFVKALEQNMGAPELLAYIDPQMTAVANTNGRTYWDLDNRERYAASLSLIEKYQGVISGGIGISQESLSDALKTVPGKITLKLGIAAVMGVTIGVYKRQLIDLASDAIATATLMKTKWDSATDVAGKKLRGSSKQVMGTLKRIHSIMDTTDKLQKTIIDTKNGTVPGGQGPANIKRGIATLIAQGVPIDNTGAPVFKNRQNVYEPVPADKSGWNAEAVSIVGSTLEQIRNSANLETTPSEITRDHQMDHETRQIILQGQRACVRSMHYVLYVLRRTTQVLDNVKYVFRVK